jgi:murein DD-endopeptidase MepM/ murein hydrolase activator NlpD
LTDRLLLVILFPRGIVMKKVIFLLMLSFSMIGNTSITKLGVGGPGKVDAEPSEIYSDPLKELDTEKVDELIRREMSVEEAFRELANIKTVDMVKPDIWPVVGVITSDYGWRVMGGRREFHTGVDISAPYGTPVSAAADGRVVYAGWLRGYGYTVIIYHGYGFATLYAHLSSLSVSYGDRVVKAQIIGKVGNTGRSFGPHLHYEVIRYGMRQNPIAYLP